MFSCNTPLWTILGLQEQVRLQHVWSICVFYKQGEDLWMGYGSRDEADRDEHNRRIQGVLWYMEPPVVFKDENKKYVGLAKS